MKNRTIYICTALLLVLCYSTLGFAEDDKNGKSERALPEVKPIVSETRNIAAPSPLVRTIIGWDNPDRSCSEVQAALDSLALREKEGDLSDDDVIYLLNFKSKLNGQYQENGNIPEEIKKIRADVGRLVTVKVHFPKPMRDRIPSVLHPLVVKMTGLSRTPDNLSMIQKELVSLNMENEALDYALKNIESKTSKSSESNVCLLFLLSMEEKTIEYYKSKAASNEGLTSQDKNGLCSFARLVENADAVCFCIDTLIDDRETAPYIESWERISDPLRFCDLVFNIAKLRIINPNEWAQKKLGMKNSDRDKLIEEFKIWWDDNVDYVDIGRNVPKIQIIYNMDED